MGRAKKRRAPERGALEQELREESMAAKKRSKKRVSVELTAEELHALLDAAEALTAIANAIVIRVDDPALQRRAKTRATKGRR